MSASTERLLEQIKSTEEAITTAVASGQDASQLKEDLKYFQRKLATCNEALTEGAQKILKG